MLNLHQLFDWQYIGKIIGRDLVKFFGLLRIYEYMKFLSPNEIKITLLIFKATEQGLLNVCWKIFGVFFKYFHHDFIDKVFIKVNIILVYIFFLSNQLFPFSIFQSLTLCCQKKNESG